MGMLHHSPPVTSKRRVFLAVPAYGQVPPLFAYSLTRSVAVLQDAGFDVEYAFLTGNCHVDDARNKLVQAFLASKCGDFVFLDADLGWRPSDLVKLLGFDRDVVGGTYPLKQLEDGFPVRFIPGEIWSDSDGLIEVDGLPTGFLRFKREALEKLAAKAIKYRIKGSDDVGEIPLIFERTVVNGGRVSGDYSACAKWRKLGGKIYLDPSFFMEHVGEKVWSGNVGSYLRRKNGLALQALEKVKAKTATANDYLSLVLDWGNDPYSGSVELLIEAAAMARRSKKILESGSGLTTLVMASANPDCTIWCMESSPEWMAKIVEAAKRLKLDNVVVRYAPLVDRFYQVDVPWGDFDAVLVDGPKRSDGDRERILGKPISPREMLVDDAETEAAPFLVLPGYEATVKGVQRAYATLKFKEAA